MKQNQQLLKINRTFLICFAISSVASALVAQALADQEDYLNTTYTMIVGYVVFFVIFGSVFYFENKNRYKTMGTKLVLREITKLVSSFGVGEIVYISVRWSLQFYFLGMDFEPYLASLVSEGIATVFYMGVVTIFIKITKVFG